jgi:hypothetical protein
MRPSLAPDGGRDDRGVGAAAVEFYREAAGSQTPTYVHHVESTTVRYPTKSSQPGTQSPIRTKREIAMLGGAFRDRPWQQKRSRSPEPNRHNEPNQ